MELLGLFNRGWALRYLREAKAELRLAREEPRFSRMFSFEAARKAQACIYHCLGDPDTIEMVVFDLMVDGKPPADKVMHLLLTVARLVQLVSEVDDPAEAYRVAQTLVELASKVVKSVLGEGEG